MIMNDTQVVTFSTSYMKNTPIHTYFNTSYYGCTPFYPVWTANILKSRIRSTTRRKNDKKKPIHDKKKPIPG